MKKNDKNLKEIPITIDFNHNQKIGIAVFDTQYFKKNMLFAPAFILRENGDIELLEISLIPDDKFIKYKDILKK